MRLVRREREAFGLYLGYWGEMQADHPAARHFAHRPGPAGERQQFAEALQARAAPITTRRAPRRDAITPSARSAANACLIVPRDTE